MSKRSSSVSSGIHLGNVLAAILSWSLNHDLFWALIHGLFGWLYIVYWFIFLRS